MGQQEDEVIRHIHDSLFDDQGRPDFRNFAGSRRLYSTDLDSYGLLLSIIDGVSRPAPFQYQALLDIVREATEGGAAHWVTILFHDNMVAVPVAVKSAGNPWNRAALEFFESEAGAEQGGVSFFALVPGGKDWLLWHCYDPCNDFTIDFFGPIGMCERLDLLLDQGRRGGDNSAQKM